MLTVDVHCCHLLFDHFQFALIRGPNIPGSYAYCSLRLWTLLSPPDTSTTERCFRFGPFASFFHGASNCPLLYPRYIGHLPAWGAYLLVSSLFAFSYSFGVLLARILWSGLPFPSPVDHVLSVLFALTRPSWVALHSMTLSFTELHRPLHHKAVFREGEVTWGSGSCGTFGLSS